MKRQLTKRNTGGEEGEAKVFSVEPLNEVKSIDNFMRENLSKFKEVKQQTGKAALTKKTLSNTYELRNERISLTFYLQRSPV